MTMGGTFEDQAASAEEVGKAIADVEESVASHRNVQLLMTENREEVRRLKSMCKADIDAVGGGDGVWCMYDDLFLLRYILSLGSAEASARAVRETIKWRAQPATQEIIRKIHEDTWKDEPIVKESMKWQVAGALEEPCGQLDGGFTVLIRGGFTNNEMLFSLLSAEEHLRLSIAYREIGFYKCDKVTRRTGVLTKQVIIFDLKGASMSDMTDKRMREIHTKTSAMAALFYPQLQDKIVMVNAPSWMTSIVSVVRRILPKRNMDKVALYSSGTALFKSEWGKSTLNQAALPSFVGGTMGDSAIPSVLKGSMVLTASDAGMSVTQVRAGRLETVTTDVSLPHASAHYIFTVDSYGVYVTAQLIPADDGDVVVLMERQKFEASDGARKGILKCGVVGKLVFTFDNTHSIIRGKNVKHKIEITGPKIVDSSVLSQPSLPLIELC